jgi:hypothetical protein
MSKTTIYYYYNKMADGTYKIYKRVERLPVEITLVYETDDERDAISYVDYYNDLEHAPALMIG